MNKKIILTVIILLILGLGFYFLKDSSNVNKLSPAASETPAQNPQEQLTVELGLKTSSTASESAAMNVQLPANSDHCEVLKKALEQGKLENLDMRYQEKYQTNGVYVINGIGKKDSPWWVYKINGTDAPAGCSQIKVAQGDKILWEYIGE